VNHSATLEDVAVADSLATILKNALMKKGRLSAVIMSVRPSVRIVLRAIYSLVDYGERPLHPIEN
jgi:hypothetical protein